MILVTGGTGFIGSHLLQKLSSLGEPARVLARPRRHARRFPTGVQAFEGDLSSGRGLVDALSGADTVIHLAGVTKALNPREYYAGNAEATENLVRALQGRSVRLVHISSLAAIGPSQGHAPVQEDAEPHPVSDYGKSKLEAERIVRSLAPDAVIVRPPVVYGPRDTDVFQLLKSISKGLVLEIAGGERWFSAIYVEDLVEGLIAAARAPRAAGRAYFLTNSKPASWSELAAIAAGIMRRRPRVLRVPVAAAYSVAYCAELWSRVSRVPGILSRDKVAEALCTAWICDHRRAAEELHFEATTPLASGLAKTLAWYREAGWLKY
jgi:nucleoside-diphosphate-sugar epimerase